MAINKATFDLEAESMDKVFYKYMLFNAISKKMQNDIRYGMPDYLSVICGTYCKNCATIICLNKFLDKWRVFINNQDELLGYREYITDKILETIYEINEIFGHNIRFNNEMFLRFPHLCGCSNFNRYIKEGNIWNNHIRSYKGGKFEGFIIDEHNNISTVICNTHDEYKNIFESKLFSWRNDLNKNLKHLLLHKDYFKRIPHKVYRDNILIPLTFVLNRDCVNIIIEFL